MSYYFFTGKNPFDHLLKAINVTGENHKFYDVGSFGEKYGNILFIDDLIM